MTTEVHDAIGSPITAEVSMRLCRLNLARLRAHRAAEVVSLLDLTTNTLQPGELAAVGAKDEISTDTRPNHHAARAAL